MLINTAAHLKEKLNSVVLEDLLIIGQSDLPWGQLDKKTILITGGGGFIGGYLTQCFLVLKRLYGVDIKVECAVRSIESAKIRFKPWKGEKNFNIFYQDVSKPLEKNFPKADLIIHCASQASPKYYGKDPVGTLMANTIGTNNLLEHASKSGAQKFMFLSSGEVYGVPVANNKLISEVDYGYLDPMMVRSCYAESKRIGETMCASWSHQYNLHTIVARPFHTYGPGMSLTDGRVFSDFVADVVAGRNVVLRSSGNAMRPFCYLSDAIIGILTVLLKGESSEAYNVGNPFAEISIKDLAFKLTKIFPNKGIGVVSDLAHDTDYMQSPVSRSSPNISKLNDLGWSPRIGVDEGFYRTILSFL